jgi:radical SAM superfamily enzyme YgiQ (UPF0313 family)
MHYEGHIIRPPSEADSIILQVTVGCSHNRCTFCGAYKNQRFRIKSDEVIDEDIAYAVENMQDSRRVFLCDGDAMIIPQKRLVGILQMIEEKLPRVTRVGLYANARSLKKKTPEDLRELKTHGMGIAYMGLESGDDVTLKQVHKKGTSDDIVEQGRKVKDAGIKLSVTVLLGLAGSRRSEIHARKTGEALSKMNPEFVGALTLMLIPGTPLHDDLEAGSFVLLGQIELLKELRTMIEHTHMTRGLFLANHASNYLPIRARLPKDKEQVLIMIDEALKGKIPLKPEWMRAL